MGLVMELVVGGGIGSEDGGTVVEVLAAEEGGGGGRGGGGCGGLGGGEVRCVFLGDGGRGVSVGRGRFLDSDMSPESSLAVAVDAEAEVSLYSFSPLTMASGDDSG